MVTCETTSMCGCYFLKTALRYVVSWWCKTAESRGFQCITGVPCSYNLQVQINLLGMFTGC